MKSESTGKHISEVEILNVSPHGFWLMLRGAEYFLSFSDFPWFQSATLAQLFAVELLHDDHLYWPDLDIDLDRNRILNPGDYPLVAKLD